MPLPSSGMKHSWIFSLKLFLISVGAVTTILSVPLMFKFAWNDLPAIWSGIIRWMEPPYLYLIINGIIITIIASTRFQSNHHQDNQSQHHVVSVTYNPPNVSPQYSDIASDLPPVSSHLSFGVIKPQNVTHGIESSLIVEPQSKRPYIMDVKTVPSSDFIESESKSVVNSPPETIQPEFDFPVRTKRVSNSRFVQNRKLTKFTSSEGTRGIRKPKKHETLDNTWKMITDGRQLPLPSSRNFRRSDTFLFQNLHSERQFDESTAAAKTKVVRKSETFKDRTSYHNQNEYRQPSSPESLGKLKKELSLTEDELTRRVEAFIKKFNDNIRLQRQKSLEK